MQNNDVKQCKRCNEFFVSSDEVFCAKCCEFIKQNWTPCVNKECKALIAPEHKHMTCSVACNIKWKEEVTRTQKIPSCLECNKVLLPTNYFVFCSTHCSVIYKTKKLTNEISRKRFSEEPPRKTRRVEPPRYEEQPLLDIYQQTNTSLYDIFCKEEDSILQKIDAIRKVMTFASFSLQEALLKEENELIRHLSDIAEGKHRNAPMNFKNLI